MKHKQSIKIFEADCLIFLNLCFECAQHLNMRLIGRFIVSDIICCVAAIKTFDVQILVRKNKTFYFISLHSTMINAFFS